MDGCPLGLGLVVEDKPTEFSCSSAKDLNLSASYFLSGIKGI